MREELCASMPRNGTRLTEILVAWIALLDSPSSDSFTQNWESKRLCFIAGCFDCKSLSPYFSVFQCAIPCGVCFHLGVCVDSFIHFQKVLSDQYNEQCGQSDKNAYGEKYPGKHFLIH